MKDKNYSLSYDTLSNIASDYGDSYYILSLMSFKKNYSNFLRSFRSIYPKSNIAYSYKTNYTPDLCLEVNSAGGYAEVVSEMELDLALKIGVDPKKIIYNGPFKSKHSFEKCLALGGCVNIGSNYECEILFNFSRKYPKKALNIGVRCNFNILGGGSRFGLDIYSSEFKEMFTNFNTLGNINLKGFHCHLPNHDLSSYKERINSLLEASDRYFNSPPDFIDCGGGYFSRPPECLKEQFNSPFVSFEEYAGLIASTVKEHYADYSHEQCPELILEPGRALVADAMTFVAKVIDVSTIRGRNIVTVAGSQYNLTPKSLNINSPIQVFSRQDYNNAKTKYDIVGYTCIEDDILYKDYKGHVKANDYVCFKNVGSYSMVLKPPFIMPSVPIISLDSPDNIRLIKKKQSFSNIFNDFVLYDESS